MGAEPYPNNFNYNNGGEAPIFLGLQPAALIDHVARVDWSLLDKIPGEKGGSLPVTIEEVEHILSEVKTHTISSTDGSSSVKTMAGGSLANTVRGLSAGFGVSCGIIGAYGDDDQGQVFVNNMSSNGVNISRMREKNGLTGQCVCLVDAFGNRTMRPCLISAVKLQANDLTREDFKGSKWLLLRYNSINLEAIQAAIRIAKQEGLLVSMDLASFEMIRNFKGPLLELLESRDIDLCFANEDEAKELLSNYRDEQHVNPEVALDFLAKYCKWAVVTLGANGCIAKHGKETAQVPATGVSTALDATGAGDLFASGFLYGLHRGLSLEECCKVGTCSGGSVVRSLGVEVTPENWHWMYKELQIKGLPVPVIRQ